MIIFFIGFSFRPMRWDVFPGFNPVASRFPWQPGHPFPIEGSVAFRPHLAMGLALTGCCELLLSFQAMGVPKQKKGKFFEKACPF
jgi:hypothetical protein